MLETATVPVLACAVSFVKSALTSRGGIVGKFALVAAFAAAFVEKIPARLLFRVTTAAAPTPAPMPTPATTTV